jgi:hypothetical protein
VLLSELQAQHFSARLHDVFSISLGDGTVIDLSLQEVTEWGPAATSRFRRPFSLLFMGPESDGHLPQGTYPIADQILGLLEIFIVPVGPDGRRMRYEAIFS